MLRVLPQLTTTPLRGLFIAILVAGLSGQVSAAGEPSPDLQSDFDRFLQWFEGEFDNNEQVWQQAQDGVAKEDQHEHIHHIFMSVHAPNIGEHTFFIRQYMDGDYENVYRQRLYNFFIDDEEQAIRLQIFSFNDESRYRNTDRDPAQIEGIKREEVRNMPGCDVFWTFERGHFVGRMKDKACFFHSERLGKDIYISDTLKLTDSEIWIGDTARDAEGNLVFGREEHHKNRKVRYFSGWAVLSKNRLDATLPEDDYLVIRGLRIHNEGQIVPLLTDDGEETGYSIELARLTYQNTETPILKLAVLDSAGYAFTYIWANTEATRLGINMRWLQVGLTAED